MKILTGKQVREADRFTIEHEPIASLDLMERASSRIAQYLAGRFPAGTRFAVFVGKGNNGGDGLAVARLLYRRKYPCTVYTLFPPEAGTGDYRANLDRLPSGVAAEPFSPNDPPQLKPGTVILDALLGTGVSGEVKELVASAIGFINGSGCAVVSLDLPSGLTTEFGNAGRKAVEADLTLTLQFPKLSLLLPEGGENGGEVVVLPIGLDERYTAQAQTPYYYLTEDVVRLFVERRQKFAHKGTYGHALLICGSEGMMGAAVLAAGGALRSGCGLVTVRVPQAERNVLYVTRPSALVSGDPGTCFSEPPEDLGKYTAVGVGPGLGQAPATATALRKLLEVYRRPVVLDADALNLLAADRELFGLVPPDSILTPHPGELKRLIGDWKDDREKLEKTLELARNLKCFLIVKGAYSAVCTPGGDVWFNSTGNPGMAKGGSGDVLTGLLTGLLAKGMDAQFAAMYGVYMHGRAGDEAARLRGMESMDSADIVEALRLDMEEPQEMPSTGERKG